MAKLIWDEAVQVELAKVPALLRGFVAKKVEDLANQRGVDRVDLDIWAEVRRMRPGRTAPDGPGEVALNSDLPPADVLAALVRTAEAQGQTEGSGHRLRVCGGAFGCPRPQVDVAGLSEALQAELAASGHDAELEVALGGRVLTHQKLAIAVSGCVNGCSEPQIKDFAVLGQTRPEAVPEKCSGCGRCERACKENAVRAGQPRVASASPDPAFDRTACLNCGDCARSCPTGAIALATGYCVLVGGRLGRHPRLADVLIPFTPNRSEVLAALRATLAWARAVGTPGERLASLVEREGLVTLRTQMGVD